MHDASERALQEEEVRKFTESTLKREERTTMIKKTGDLALTAGTEEVIAVNSANSNDLAIEDKDVSVEYPDLEEKVNLVIQELLDAMSVFTMRKTVCGECTLR